MRRACIDYSILGYEDQFIGISLGYDYCSEHEWGIKGIRRQFAIPESSKKNMGINNRIITAIPKVIFTNDNSKKDEPIELLFFKKSKKKGQLYAILWVGSPYTKPINRLPFELENYKDELDWNDKWRKDNPDNAKDPVITAWDESSFGVAVKGEKEVEWLEYLYGQFKVHNVVISRLNISGDSPFANASLSLLIKDRIPQEGIDSWYATDKEFYDREDYEKKIGMKKIIKKYGNNNGYHEENWFIACSPKWIDYDDKENREKRKKELGTKYNIIYWINYSDDDDIHGWFTVEDIKKWLTTKGLKLSQVIAQNEKEKRSVTK
jgi:hypothetical protein